MIDQIQWGAVATLMTIAIVLFRIFGWSPSYIDEIRKDEP